MSCRVSQCKFAISHVTSSHVCGTCGEKGHGQVECGNNQSMQRLRRYDNDKINFLRRCDIGGCPNPETHHRDAHHCINCRKRHPETQCIIQSFENHKHRFPNDSYFNNFDVPRFVTENIDRSAVVPVTMGMGCMMYIKYTDAGVQTLFMHSDNWGQYDGVNDAPVYNNFIEGCIILDTNMYTPSYAPPAPPAPLPLVHDVMCPICRTMNQPDEIMDVKGCEEECKICFSENVEKFFSKCGHAVVCNSCYERL